METAAVILHDSAACAHRIGNEGSAEKLAETFARLATLFQYVEDIGL